MHLEPYILIIAIIGLASLAMTWLPKLLENLPFSYPILFVAVGALLFWLPLELPIPEPTKYNTYVVHLTELGVIITLMGTGLKLEREFNWQNWSVPFRLVTITMLLSISILAVMAWGIVGLTPAAAILLGAILAPTDPVLAGDVQVGPPSEGKEDHVRFSLTAEAGLNDGMAFPFVWLAIEIALAGNTEQGWLGTWLWQDLLYRIAAGVAVGYLLGRVLVYLVFYLPKKTSFPKAEDALLALAATLVSYAFAEILQGYGFIAVFITGLTFGSYERHEKLHRELHDFTDQLERLLVVILLIVFGGSLVYGLLDHLTWAGALVGLVFVFIVRPLAGWVGLLGVRITKKERAAISFFGIRGIGSFYYLAFALYKVEFKNTEALWSITGFVVLVSIILHGITATPVMKYLDLRRIKEGRKEDEFLKKSKA